MHRSFKHRICHINNAKVVWSGWSTLFDPSMFLNIACSLNVKKKEGNPVVVDWEDHQWHRLSYFSLAHLDWTLEAVVHLDLCQWCELRCLDPGIMGCFLELVLQWGGFRVCYRTVRMSCLLCLSPPEKMMTRVCERLGNKKSVSKSNPWGKSTAVQFNQ